MNENLDPTGNQSSSEDQEIDKALRPLSFDDFAGQETILENLKVFVEAAKLREEALDIIDQIFEFLDKDEQLKKDLEAYDIMYSNRELARNKIEIKTWKQ